MPEPLGRRVEVFGLGDFFRGCIWFVFGFLRRVFKGVWSGVVGYFLDIEFFGCRWSTFGLAKWSSEGIISFLALGSKS